MVAQCLCGNCFLYSVGYEIVLNYVTSVYFLMGCSFKLNLEDLVCFFILFCYLHYSIKVWEGSLKQEARNMKVVLKTVQKYSIGKNRIMTWCRTQNFRNMISADGLDFVAELAIKIIVFLGGVFL